MGTFTIIDAEGKWVVNPHAFRFVDPETRNAFLPGHPMKVNALDKSWVAGQIDAGVLVVTRDPTKAPPKAAAPPPGPPAGPG